MLLQVRKHFLQAEISRPVTYEGDPDCQDTYEISVDVEYSVDREGDPYFYDARVREDVRADNGSIAYHEGEELREQSLTEANIEELSAAFLVRRKAVAAGEYDSADECQSFPADNIEYPAAFNFDQRRTLLRVA